MVIHSELNLNENQKGIIAMGNGRPIACCDITITILNSLKKKKKNNNAVSNKIGRKQALIGKPKLFQKDSS